ncbi:MAG: NAD(P)H-dependent oxidoreductase subunit E [Actinobacteria bacterium]|jgi:[NiFe] hydrogenase diaphorase moiety large subunit|nr:NAD(P)H-dependent oxidoreductase subunit E [Actinomycetota bacterium]
MATTMTNDELRADIEALVERLGPGRASLIPILADVKRRFHEIDSETMQTIADVLDIHPVEVHSVASFYAFLHSAPEGQFVIRLCGTLPCDFAGKQAVADALRTELGIGFDETTEDGLFTLEWTSCMGMCDQGPALLVNDEVHTRVTPEKAKAVVAACRAAAVAKEA